jgi:hypothetical protein
MKNLYFLFLLTAFALSLKAQNLITVQHGSTATFYTDLQASITAAQDGDYIYIPGGTWAVPGTSMDINKRINIYGSGALSDSTNATGVTLIAGAFRFNSGSSNSHVSGCKFTYGVIVGADSCVNYVDNIMFQYNYGSINCYSKCRNIVIKNNVLSTIGISRTQNFQIQNNICYGSCNIGNGSFTSPLTYGFLYNNFIYKLVGGASNPFPSGITFKNNYFQNSSSVDVFLNSTFINNFSTFSLTIYGSGGGYNNTFINNQIVGNANIIFTNVPITNQYDALNNYQIISTSPAHNAGDDGTDIGIYGGAHPWKEGLVPANPHIRFSNINSQTGAGGNLPVNIKVGAQDH